MELTVFLRQLRHDLYEAMLEAKDEPLRLVMEQVEVEVSIATSVDNTNGFKVQLYVVEAGTEMALGSEHTHRVKLQLRPRFDGVDSDPWVAGDPVPGEI